VFGAGGFAGASDAARAFRIAGIAEAHGPRSQAR